MKTEQFFFNKKEIFDIFRINEIQHAHLLFSQNNNNFNLNITNEYSNFLEIFNTINYSINFELDSYEYTRI